MEEDGFNDQGVGFTCPKFEILCLNARSLSR
jgi:hypothetical protein